MEKSNDLSYATLKPELLEKVQKLEQELQSATNQKVFLLAYEQPDEPHISADSF